jgi:hypothetical protein
MSNDAVVRSTLVIDKLFLRKERNQLYGDWTIAFWRELFQNSVDAGAKKISIDLNEKPQRGSFGSAGPEGKTVTNVVFSDDGHGMTAEVLDDVYFKMGKSTKDVGGGSNIGGFGRARIMTCFSQERYTILTCDRFVMGDGVHFEHGSVGSQLAELEKYAAALESSDQPGAAASIAGIRADMELLSQAWSRRGGFPGCRVEVDLDASPSDHWRSKPGTIDNMKAALKTYLSESQLPCEVVINGKSPEEYFEVEGTKLQAKRGPVRRTLTVSGENDEEVPFATVHTSEGKKADFKGKMIVRVSGASMFRKDVQGLEAQVIVEIDPAQSRDALNSNRDGLKGDYERAVDRLLADLTLDTLSALRDKTTKVTEIKGEKGRILSQPVDLAKPMNEPLSADEVRAIESSVVKAPRVSSVEALAATGIPQDALKKFLTETYHGSSFLNAYVTRRFYDDDPAVQELIRLRDALYESQRSPEWFFENASEGAKAWVLSGVRMRLEEAFAERNQADAKRLAGMHDVYINMESTNERTKAAARRHNPENWSEETGKGKMARSLLTAWTAACGVAMDTLFRLRPAMHPVNWTTGFVYSVPESTYQGDTYRNVSIEAQCITLSHDDVRLLINPVFDDGNLRYSLANRGDLKKILVLAFHEVAHVLESSHNETFANALTDIMIAADWELAFRRMKAEVAAVTAAYASGKARVHALDEADGPRPAERLLTLASGRNSVPDGAVTRIDRGLIEVDADAVRAGAERSWDEAEEDRMQARPGMRP